MKTLTAEQREVVSQLKARLWLAISRIVEEETASIDGAQRVTATPKFVAALVELAYNQAVSLGEDLESFSRHAGRKTITPADMFMVTRKNDDLTQLLREYLEQLNEAVGGGGGGGGNNDDAANGVDNRASRR